MKKVHRIKDGFYIEDVVLREDELMPGDCTDIPLPEGVFWPAQIVDGVWKTTLTPEEVEEKTNYVLPKAQLEILQETVDQLVLDNLIRGF